MPGHFTSLDAVAHSIVELSKTENTASSLWVPSSIFRSSSSAVGVLKVMSSPRVWASNLYNMALTCELLPTRKNQQQKVLLILGNFDSWEKVHVPCF